MVIVRCESVEDQKEFGIRYLGKQECMPRFSGRYSRGALFHICRRLTGGRFINQKKSFRSKMKYLTGMLLICCAVAVALAKHVPVRRSEINELDEERRHSFDYYKRASPVAALEAAVAAGELAIKIQDRAIALVKSLGGATQLKNRHRSLELVIANDLANTKLEFAEEYFDSGTWFSHPDFAVAPMDATIATVANRQGSVLTGVTGGMSFKIVGTGKYLVLGFTNPQFGSYKTWVGIRDQPSAYYGYSQAYDDSLKRRCEGGFAVIARMTSSDIAMRRFIFGIGPCTE